MSTAIKDSMTDHSPLDGTDDAINGSEVDANPNSLADILDGTSAVDLAGAGALDVLFSSAHVGVRFLNTDAAAGAVRDAVNIEWDPSDASNLTDNTSGVAIAFTMPGDDDVQDVYARIAAMCVSDAAGAEKGALSFRVAQGGGIAQRMYLDPLGNLGLGASAFGTNASNTIGLAHGVAPTTSPAGMIQIYAEDSSDGAVNATLAIRTEQAVEAIGTFTASHKLKVWINGTEYWIQLDAV